VSRSRPITGAASGDHDRYRQNYERIFERPTPKPRRPAAEQASKPRCGECMEPLTRYEVGFCERCLKGYGPGIRGRHE
jgi:hypothetical protein